MDVSGATQPVMDEWQSHAVWSAETGLKIRSCPKNPMKFAGDLRNRTDDVMQGEDRWSPCQEFSSQV